MSWGTWMLGMHPQHIHSNTDVASHHMSSGSCCQHLQGWSGDKHCQQGLGLCSPLPDKRLLYVDFRRAPLYMHRAPGLQPRGRARFMCRWARYVLKCQGGWLGKFAVHVFCGPHLSGLEKSMAGADPSGGSSKKSHLRPAVSMCHGKQTC